MGNLIIVLGDQLEERSAALAGLDPERDAVWMAEVDRETGAPWCHKRRIVLFLAAMRHFRDRLRRRGITVHYTELAPDPADDRGATFGELLAADARRLRPERLVVVEPGDWRVAEDLRTTAAALGLELAVRPDRHFYASRADFDAWAAGRRALTLEHFYRWMRKREGVLVNEAGEPVGGQWNFDHENRETFGPEGPPPIPRPRGFRPDGVTRGVIALVDRRFAHHPGRLAGFDLPVTPRQARSALDDFVTQRLPRFGPYQDAMAAGEPFLYHARLSSSLNLKLLDPRTCVEKAVAAYEAGEAPLASVEGFVRQILGWRELIRGIYWRFMPGYIEHNALGCTDRDVPECFWSGETEMNCVREAMRHVLDHGYAHHIERLMVLGLFAMQLGVHPRRFHDWHMAMYVDAVDWVSLPNALGMSQFGDGGIVGTKPYAASGAYVSRMSDYCAGCRYDPKRATGEDACPITTLYWDFLDRHRERFAGNRRMAFQMKNLSRKPERELAAIRERADRLRAAFDGGA